MVTAPRTVNTARTAGLVKLSVGPFAVALPMGQVLRVERADAIRDDGEFQVLPLADALGGAWPIPPRTGQVVLVEHAGQRFGFWVEKVTPLSRTVTPRLTPAPALGINGPFAEVALLDDGPLPLLDLDRLFGEQPEAPRPARPRPASPQPVATTNRLFAVGEFEYPAPGGRTIGFGLSAGCVDEITEVTVGTKVPGTPPHVVAVIEWRGRAVPKVDPAAWCGLPPLPQDHSRVAVVRTGSGDRIAVATGGVVTALPLPLPHTAGRLSLPLDPERVLGTLELPGRTLVLPRWDVAAGR